MTVTFTQSNTSKICFSEIQKISNTETTPTLNILALAVRSTYNQCRRDIHLVIQSLVRMLVLQQEVALASKYSRQQRRPALSELPYHRPRLAATIQPALKSLMRMLVLLEGMALQWEYNRQNHHPTFAQRMLQSLAHTK